MLSNQQFDRARRLASSLAGIELLDRHRELVCRRSRRLGILDSAGLDSLLGAAEEGEPSAAQKLLCLLTTRFTGFFRHPRHFEIAAAHALRAARERGGAGLWSAAAATGEEPYSLAMALIEILQREDPPVTILATEISEEALAVARSGKYGESALGGLTPEQRARFFRESGCTKLWTLAPEVQRMVEFHALNLIAPAWPLVGEFDVIFARNVLMYLEAGCRQAILDRMAALLAPDGLLVLDPVEHPGPAERLFAPVKDGIYTLRSSSPTSSKDGRSPAHWLEGPSP
jgi:chemotaxis protein methyltransferase CheR